MNIVVDTNIVFSAIINSESRIAQILTLGHKYFDFYSINLLKDEIFNHKNKILKLKGVKENTFALIYDLITRNIRFIDDILISDDDFKKAAILCKDVDEDDALFVALSLHLNAPLWTGDKKLIAGISKKNFNKIMSTEKMYSLFLKKEFNNPTSRIPRN